VQQNKDKERGWNTGTTLRNNFWSGDRSSSILKEACENFLGVFFRLVVQNLGVVWLSLWVLSYCERTPRIAADSDQGFFLNLTPIRFTMLPTFVMLWTTLWVLWTTLWVLWTTFVMLWTTLSVSYADFYLWRITVTESSPNAWRKCFPNVWRKFTMASGFFQ
jgi:hypothetical protein